MLKKILSKIRYSIIYNISEGINEMNYISSTTSVDDKSKIIKSKITNKTTIRNAKVRNSTLSGNIQVLEHCEIENSEILDSVNIGRSSTIVNSFISGDITKIGENVRINGGNFVGSITLDNYSSVWGPNICFRGTKDASIHIGKFCSIARNVSIQTYNHNFKKITSYFIGKNIFDEHWENEKISKGEVIIKNDVWIGSDCVILGGVTIGNGAIIAANSVVTIDVPNYAIVAGSPAKILSYRFENDIIESLLQLKWWDWSIEKIKENKLLFKDELNLTILKDLSK